MNNIRYLYSNGVTIKDYVNNHPFPSKPFELSGSEEFLDAIKFNNYKLVQQGINRNPNYINQYDYMKQTSFHWAAKLGYDQILKLLLKYSKQCNVYDKKYRTPLYIAALNNQKKCVEILLEKGGNAYIADNYGKKPEDVTNDIEIRILLQTSNEKHFTELNKYKDNNRGQNQVKTEIDNIIYGFPTII